MPLASATVKLVTAHTRYNLLTLAAAVNAAFKSPIMGATSGKELTLQADPSNGAAKIYVGDSTVADPSTTQNCGYVLLAGGTDLRRGLMDDVPFGEFYAMSDTANALLNIMISRI
jgi:hypothetical protein